LCNLYSVTKGQQAIRELAGAMHDRTGNLPPLYGIFPDYSAPIVRNQPEGRELMMARWGMPSPVFALKGKKSDPGVTNVRNVKSPHWRRQNDGHRFRVDRPDLLIRFGRQKREDIICCLAFLYFPDRRPTRPDARKEGQWPGIVEGEPNRRTRAVWQDFIF